MLFLTFLEKRNKPTKVILWVLLVGVIGALDLLTGPELAFSLFYLIPVMLATWLINQRHGIMASLISAIVWSIADQASGTRYSHPLYIVWNTIIRLSFFVITAWLLSAVKRTLEKEKVLSFTDYLTGAVNSRMFFQLMGTENDRLQRSHLPYTLAYIDLDDFKAVNDQFGHLTGDTVLQMIAQTAKKHLRKTDIFARVGGDEFVLLMPETGQEDAYVVLHKLQTILLAEMQQHHWQVTFSIGAVTCSAAARDTRQLVQMADELMYSVKRSGKNGIRFSTYTGS